jgi:nitroimidazol reductase NimA-like FMN-containing flavoprotein (pyridoxamine 5'-phosphate oxidase superfamily)
VQDPVIRADSAWPAGQIAQFLRETTIPVRLAFLARDGAPLVCSLWYLHEAGAIWCATQRSAKIIALLDREPRCALEVAGDLAPYRGVRGQGRAVLVPAAGPDVLLRLIDRYLGSRDGGFARWLVARQAHEVAIRIEPAWLTSWDFSQRMGQ